jgi:hypothetical protein
LWLYSDITTTNFTVFCRNHLLWKLGDRLFFQLIPIAFWAKIIGLLKMLLP